MQETTPSESAVAKALHEIEDQGYTILENVIDADLLDTLSEELLLIERDASVVPSSNDFEGHKTVRIYNLLAMQHKAATGGRPYLMNAAGVHEYQIVPPVFVHIARVYAWGR